MEYEIKDSGKREEFDTGSLRDTQDGKGRFDLLPFGPLLELAIHYEQGAAKYGDHNWKKGQPISRYVSSMMRHAAKVSAGMLDENHAIAAAWNAFAIAWTRAAIRGGKLPEYLEDVFDSAQFREFYGRDRAPADSQCVQETYPPTVAEQPTPFLTVDSDGITPPEIIEGLREAHANTVFRPSLCNIAVVKTLEQARDAGKITADDFRAAIEDVLWAVDNFKPSPDAVKMGSSLGLYNPEEPRLDWFATWSGLPHGDLFWRGLAGKVRA